MLLQVENLGVTLGTGERSVRAVDGVSFSLERGETYCLVGESGSGKSITALSIMRLLPRDAVRACTGSIRFRGTGMDRAEDLLQAPEARMQQIRGGRIAMIFQEPMTSLNPVFTIGEQILETLRLHFPELGEDEARERVLAALREARLPQPELRMHSYPHQLSGGQRQRVMIAMAIACQPDLLIADEPTTALDVTVQEGILELMKDLQRRTGMGLLFITHDFGVVSHIADRIGVMQKGRLVEQGETRRVIRAPQHDYTRHLIEALPENLKRRRPPEPVASDAEPLIRLKDLEIHFPIRKGLLRREVDRVRAVDGVSLEIPRGSILALVGESGCGKTTLGRGILRLVEPTAGRVCFGDTDLLALDLRALRPMRRHLQIIFQDPMSSLNPRLSVAAILTEPMAVHGIGSSREARIERAAALLERVQLPRDALWRYPHEFSGGQRQRIGIARALSLSPEFIVCDEITSALDVSVQAEILQLLLELRREQGLTLLFITHNIGVVDYLADRTAVMKAGRIVEQGDTEQVINRPRHPYTQRLIAAVPRVDPD